MIGEIYDVLIQINTRVYFKIMIVVALGSGAGFLISMLTKWFKIRAPALVYTLAFLLLAYLVYMTWVAWMYRSSGFNYWVFSPLEMANIASQAAGEGVWREGWGIDAPVIGGTSVWMAWIIECVTIIGVGLICVIMSVRQHYFCEDCQRWLSDPRQLGLFGIPSEGLENHFKATILALTPAKGLDSHVLEAKMRTCDQCEETNVFEPSLSGTLSHFAQRKHVLIRGMLWTKEETKELWDRGLSYLDDKGN